MSESEHTATSNSPKAAAAFSLGLFSRNLGTDYVDDCSVTLGADMQPNHFSKIQAELKAIEADEKEWETAPAPRNVHTKKKPWKPPAENVRSLQQACNEAFRDHPHRKWYELGCVFAGCIPPEFQEGRQPSWLNQAIVDAIRKAIGQLGQECLAHLRILSELQKAATEPQRFDATMIAIVNDVRRQPLPEVIHNPCNQPEIRLIGLLIQEIVSAVGLDSACKRSNPVAEKPIWDSGTLLFEGNVCKVFKQRAGRQRALLNAFQELGWPQIMDDPLPKGKLAQTVKDLNKTLEHIQLYLNGTGKAVGWRKKAISPGESSDT